jgi:hypothetical protein
MNESEIIRIAINEIESKNWGTTRQFLEIHDIIRKDDKPITDRIDLDGNDSAAIVYFPVQDEKFYLAICLETKPDIVITGIYVEPYVSVSLVAHSINTCFDQLQKMTTLIPTGGWKKGEAKTTGGNILNRYNFIRFEPNPGPDAFEDKISGLLDLLETDLTGVSVLVEKAGAYIQVAMEYHHGNTMLGGPRIGKQTVSRLAALELGIDFDLYTAGRSYE